MVDTPDDCPDPDRVNVFGTEVDLDDEGWCVTTIVDGRRHVVSRHATRDLARQAAAEVNTSGNRNAPESLGERRPRSTCDDAALPATHRD